MTRQQAKRLVTYLNRSARIRKQDGVTAEVVKDCVVFSGPTGKHSVRYAEDGALDRILVHWRGYCENNGGTLKAGFGRFVAWLEDKGGRTNLVVGKLRQPYRSRSAYATRPGVYWHVSRVRADGSVCTSNTHRLRDDEIAGYLL